MEEIKAYKALDGSIHMTELSCKNADKVESFKKWYELEHSLYADQHGNMDVEDVLSWLNDSRAAVLILLEEEEF